MLTPYTNWRIIIKLTYMSVHKIGRDRGGPREWPDRFFTFGVAGGNGLEDARLGGISLKLTMY